MSSTKLTEVSREDGIRDLTPIKVRGRFAKAVIAERLGNHEEAEENLKAAIEALEA